MITLGEGHTPLIELPRLGAKLGVGRLLAKMESHNPTGSYKDRIAARSLDLASAAGARGWISTSSGNGGTSFAAYGRRAGLPGILCVTETITREKLLPPVALGAHVVRIQGLGHGSTRDGERRLFETVQHAAREHGFYLGVTAHCFNDAGMRGVDAIAREIVETGVEPTAVYVPTGGGGLVAAVARGFRDLGAKAAVVAVQPEGCAPIAGYLQGRLATPVAERSSSRISGLQVPSAPDGRLAADLIQAVGGWGVSVTDDEILGAQGTLSQTEGVFVEPAAACALAGLAHDLRHGRLSAGACAVLVLTGTGLKDLATLERAVEEPPLAGVEELPEVIGRWAP